MELVSLGAPQARYEAERLHLESCLEHAAHLKLLAVEAPTLSPQSRVAEACLGRLGPCLSFRMRDAKERDRLARALGRFWREAEETPSAPPSVRELMELQPDGNCFLLLDGAERLTAPSPLGDFLEELLLRCREGLHIVLLAPSPIPFLRQTDALPRESAAVTPGTMVLDWDGASACLQSAYPGLLESDRRLVFQCSGGWTAAMDAVAGRLAADSGENAHRTPQDLARFLPAVGELLERWTAAAWTRETLDHLEKVCVCTKLPEELAERLTGEGSALLRRLAAEGFPVRSTDDLEPVYTLNPVVQTWLYHQTRRTRGWGFLLEQHRIAAAFGQERGDWGEVFRHQLRRGYIEEAAQNFRYLSFSELDASLLDEYRALLRRQSPAAMDRLPWVQLGYAVAMKYRHPNIAFRCLDRALELFQAGGEPEGVVLACCQKISMGFFATEQKGVVEDCLRILAEEKFADGELDPLLDGYRKVFTAYAVLQRGTEARRALELLEQARETAIIREDVNLRLWACFVQLLTYSQSSRDPGGLRTVLDESMELVERPEVQKPLKMCFYQTAAFVCHIEGGRYGEACACCEQAARIADAIEATGYSVYINMIHAYALDCLGRFQRAEQVILETAKRSGSILNVRSEHLWAYYLIGQSYHYFLKGDWGLALDTAEKAVSYAARSGRTSYLARGLLVLGNILADHGDCGRAEALAEQCLELCGGLERYRFYALSARFLLAQVLRAQGRREAFAACMAVLVEQSKAAGIYHYNFAKPAVICQVFRDYAPEEADKRFLMQLEAYNTLEQKPSGTPILEELRPRTPLEVCILGPFRVLSGDRVLDPCASARAGLLLRLLALSGGTVSVHRLLEAVWPDWEEKAAMNNFYFTLYQLRSYLGRKDAVTYRRGRCGLDGAVVTVDAALFQTVADRARQYLAAGDLYAAGKYFDQALSLYRGPVLDGDDLPEDALLQREALERRAFAAMREYGAACLRRRRADKAEEILSRALKNPFADEGAARLLMRAQYLSGNKSGALATYERLCRQLRLELGVEPHRLTDALADRIRNNQEIADFHEE